MSVSCICRTLSLFHEVQHQAAPLQPLQHDPDCPNYPCAHGIPKVEPCIACTMIRAFHVEDSVTRKFRFGAKARATGRIKRTRR